MRRLVIGTAGHIDHGKTALVRALTGIDADRLKEEQARGITIDLGFAHTAIGDLTLAFVDVPGHERFIRNMLAGATGIDAVLLVVAADESVMPQTREHLDICRLLQVGAGVIALTKTDIVDADLCAIAREETRALVAGTFLDDAAIVEVSSRTGDGLDALRTELLALAQRAPGRSADGPLRLPIDRVFTLRGFGTIVTGTLASGTIRTHDTLTLLPRGDATRVRGLHVHGQAVSQAVAGERVAVNVGDLQVHDISRGDTLTTTGALEATRTIDVRLEALAEAPVLKHGARVRLHQGTREVMGRVALARVLGEDEASAGVATELPPGRAAHARIRLEGPAVVTRGDRFVLRSYSPMLTIGGGVILDPRPGRGRSPRPGARRPALRTAAARARFERLDPGEGEHAPAQKQALVRACLAFIEDAGAAGVDGASLGARLGLAPTTLSRLLDAEAAEGRLRRFGDRVVAREAFDAAAQTLLELVRADAASAASAGVAREEARDRIRLETRAFDVLVDELVKGGRLAGRERLTLPGRDTGPSAAERAAMDAVEVVLQAQGLTPLEPAALSVRAALTAPAVERALAMLVREKRAVRLGGLVFHRASLDAMIADIRAMRGPGTEARVDVATFKARYGLSRKFAIPLLEFLDRERVTRRAGDVRVVL